MPDWVASFITAVKNAGPVVYTAVLSACLLLLFLPSKFVDLLGVREFIEANGTSIGILLIASASLLAAHITFAIGSVIRSLWRGYQLRQHMRVSLSMLTRDEKNFLRPYIVDDENSQYASVWDGVPNGLTSKGILYHGSMLTIPGQPAMKMPFNLQPLARKLLTKNRRYLD